MDEEKERDAEYWRDHMVCGFCHAVILRSEYFEPHGRTCHGLTGPRTAEDVLREVGIDPATFPRKENKGKHE